MTHPSSEDKISLKAQAPVMESMPEAAATQERSSLRPSRHSTTFSRTLQPNGCPCATPFASSRLHSRRTPRSRRSNGLKLTIGTEDAWKNPTGPVREPSPEAVGDVTVPRSKQTLLERVGLGSQTVMMRLGLPLKTLVAPSQVVCPAPHQITGSRVEFSNELPMMRGTTKEITLGIGTNQGVDPRGVTSTKEVYPSRGKHTSCRMSTSPTSSAPSRTSSRNKIALTSCLSSGEMSSLTDKSTLERLLKTSSPELPLMIMSSTLATTSNSRQRDRANPKPKLLMVGNGITRGRNIQRRFSGPTPTDRKSSAPIANSSSDNSWLESISPSMSSLTRLPGSSSMVTKTSLSPMSASLLSSPIKFSYHESNEVVGPSTAVLLDPAKVQGGGGTRESARAAHQSHPLAVNSTKHLGANGLTVDSPINALIVR